MSSGLVVAQVALSLVLVTGAGLFVRSFTRLTGAPLGFDKQRVTACTRGRLAHDVEPQARVDFYQRLAQLVSTVPGVARASSSLSTPLDMGLPGEIQMPGAPAGAESERVVLTNRIAPDWFATYGTAIRSGRDFDARDTATSTPVVIINEAFAHKFFPGGIRSARPSLKGPSSESSQTRSRTAVSMPTAGNARFGIRRRRRHMSLWRSFRRACLPGRPRRSAFARPAILHRSCQALRARSRRPARISPSPCARSPRISTRRWPRSASSRRCQVSLACWR